MELIIKPTGMCNFNCTFCSSNEMEIPHPKNGVQPQIKELIQQMKPTSVIVTGGEPLTIDPDYYFELQEIAKCNVALTSNLKDFYLNPSKWSEMFNHPGISIGTSFNYGNSRMWDRSTVYTEDMFLRVNDLYQNVTGSKNGLHFIAVITEENEDVAINHAHLAKRINGRCKINGAIGVGLQDTTYPRHKIFRTYLDIINIGLSEYESTCHERQLGKCAMNQRFMCETCIRSCYVDNCGKLHYSTCDERIAAGYELPMDIFPVQPKPTPPKFDEHINSNCITCELYRLCHGCPIYRAANKLTPNHCESMMKMKDELFQSGWLL